VINPLEKVFIQTYFSNKSIYRPNAKLKNKHQFNSLGMPSGHAESIVILCLLLYLNNHIHWHVAFCIIFIICLQRIITYMHTFKQVIYGCIMGLILGFIYFKLQSFWYCLLFILFYVNVLIFLIINKIDNELNKPIPKWVDESLYPIIKKKQNVNYIYKVYSLVVGLVVGVYFKFFRQSTIFCSWDLLENDMDILIKKLKYKNIDVIIGIKSGGAIITKYIAEQLSIPYSYIKISQEKYKCNKTPYNSVINDNVKHIKKIKYVVCEDINIDVDVTNKTVLILDELVYTGNTTNFVKQYLLEHKLAKEVVIGTIFASKEFKNIIKVSSSFYSIWPWGYDN
jgi:hypoxanthine phosphoribosyltransferase